MKAWHFTSDTLRNGMPVPEIGFTLKEKMVKLCSYGLHASLDPFDALKYASGCNLHYVELGGKIFTSDDKVVAQERTIISSIDATDMMCEFYRWCALQVIHLWDAPEVVKQYLETGDEKLRVAAVRAAEAGYAAATSSSAGYAAEATWAAAAGYAAAGYAAAGYAAAGYAVEAAWAAAGLSKMEEAQRVKFNELVNAAFSGVITK